MHIMTLHKRELQAIHIWPWCVERKCQITPQTIGVKLPSSRLSIYVRLTHTQHDICEKSPTLGIRKHECLTLVKGCLWNEGNLIWWLVLIACLYRLSGTVAWACANNADRLDSISGWVIPKTWLAACPALCSTLKCGCKRSKAQSRRHGGALVGLAPKAWNNINQFEIWNNIKSAEFLSNFRISSTTAKMWSLLKTFFRRFWCSIYRESSCVASRVQASGDGCRRPLVTHRKEYESEYRCTKQ